MPHQIDQPLLTVEPRVQRDGTLTAIVTQPTIEFGAAHLLTLALPAWEKSTELLSGRYFLARCGTHTDLERAEQWQIYFRRPLFIALCDYANFADSTKLARYEVVVPTDSDPGYCWLREQQPGAALNLLGPFGQGFGLRPLTRNLLLVTDDAHLPLVVGLIEPLLNRSGRVTLLLRTAAAPSEMLRARLPLAVELRLAATADEWQHHLTETVRWADQLCAALSNPAYPALAATIRQLRFRLDNGFAQVLIESDLVCGIGACLACVVPLPDGSHTRACVHGPVFDLSQLVAR
jgi:dihydroorotate dehydrogenase electron transfer subunit